MCNRIGECGEVEGGGVKLPLGWTAQLFSTWLNGSRLNTMVYRHKGENLEVRRNLYPQFRRPQWMLEHNGKDVGHIFATAKEAIGHAEDARINGH